MEVGYWWHSHRLLLLQARRLALISMALHCVPTVYRHLFAIAFGLHLRVVTPPPVLLLLQQAAAHSDSYKLYFDHSTVLQSELPLLPPPLAVFHKLLFG